MLPAGNPVSSGLLPEPRWAAMMAMGQVRAKVGELAVRIERRAGRNPLVVERAKAWEDIPAKLRHDAAVVAQLTDGGPSLQERVANGNVFVLRYYVLKVSNPTDLQFGKFAAPANALFCYAPELQISRPYPADVFEIMAGWAGPIVPRLPRGSAFVNELVSAEIIAGVGRGAQNVSEPMFSH